MEKPIETIDKAVTAVEKTLEDIRLGLEGVEDYYRDVENVLEQLETKLLFTQQEPDTASKNGRIWGLEFAIDLVKKNLITQD